MNAIGIDIGGTNLRVAKIDEAGQIIKAVKVPTEPEKGQEQIAEKIIENILALKDEDTVGVGVGVPGQVDNKSKKVLSCVNAGINDFALGQIIEDETGLRCVLDNDANVAALGEAMAGRAKGLDVVYYITWSTGIGGGLVVNGKVLTGRNYYTGEIGNIIIWPDSSHKHAIQNHGALEGESAGIAIKRYATELGFESEAEFFESYLAGDERVVEKVEYITDTFARGLANIVHTVEPDMIVLGGGVTLKSGHILIPLVQSKIDNYLMPVIQGKVSIEVAELGDDNGLIGSAYLVL